MRDDATQGARIRGVAWRKDDPPGAEYATIELERSRLRASGVAIGSDPEPYRLSFDLRTGAEFVPESCVLAAEGAGWTRRLEIVRTEQGRWSASASGAGASFLPEPGGQLDALQDALDLDLGLSPVFNTLPVLRHRLHEGGRAGDFLMIWISVPDLAIHASPQRYTFLERRAEDDRIVRFEAIGEGEDFAADVHFDADGIVIDYPGIATRIRTGGG